MFSARANSANDGEMRKLKMQECLSRGEILRKYRMEYHAKFARFTILFLLYTKTKDHVHTEEHNCAGVRKIVMYLGRGERENESSNTSRSALFQNTEKKA
jgi:hypothetical protein